jgi:hypothetical protein
MTRFPPLPLDAWRPTRDTLHGYAQVLGAVRAALTPRQKQSAHRSLRLAAAGLTTTPIPADHLTFEMLLDLTSHCLRLTTSDSRAWRQPVRGQSPAQFATEALAGLAALGLPTGVDPAQFAGGTDGAYDPAAVARFWSALSQIDQALKRFRGELRQETGEVQLWPHGFDLALLWFSGRRVPGQDPAVPRDADEQMNFGFSTGDAGIPEPYFFATAYPLPPALPSTPLPPGVRWHTQGWQGAVLAYAHVAEAADGVDQLLSYWRTLQRAGARLMLG